MASEEMNLFSIFSRQRNKLASIFLNTPIASSNVLDLLWKTTSYHVFLDGFANKIVSNSLENKFVPEVLIGDFDSIDPNVLQLYRDKKCVNVIHEEDQDSTDLTKGLMHLVKTRPDLDGAVIFFQSGGRLDHLMGILNSLFIMQDISKLDTLSPNHTLTSDHSLTNRITLMTECDLAILLKKGSYEIIVDRNWAEGMCGLIPIGCPVKVTTKGLRWDLDDTILQFGSLVSTSNDLLYKNRKSIYVECDNYLLWTMSYKL